MTTSKHKLLFITVLLAMLLVFGASVAVLPVVHASEPSITDKTISILNDVVGINTKEYTTIVNSQLDNQYISLSQKQADVSFLSNESSLRASCSFVNDMLRQIYLSDYEGELAVKQPAIATVDMAKGFLQRYQNYVGSSFYGELASMLENVNATTNMTKSAGNIKLEVLNSDNTILDYVWTCTDENGVVAKSKNVVLSYDQGQLKVFLNNWPFYKLTGIPKISAEEATAIAIEASKNFSYQVSIDNVTSTVTGFKIAPESIGYATLSYVNFPNQSLARGGDPFTLYPSWYVPLGFDKFYPGDVSSMTVSIWADTGEVSIMGPVVVDSRLGFNAEKTTGENMVPQGTAQGSTILPAQVVVAASFSVVCISLLSGKVAFKSSRGKKLFSRLGGVLLSGIILFGVIVTAMQTANASSTIPNSKARIYGALDGGQGSPAQLQQEKDAAYWMSGEIASAFTASGYSASNHCGSGTTRQNEMNHAWNDEHSYDRVAVFHFGHQSSPNWAYVDNVGTQITWDDINDNTALGKHCFIFIFVCDQARGPIYGIPTAWVGRTDMSDNGYTNPDCRGQCYISFFGYSPMISGYHQTFQEQMTGPVKYFVKYFYDYALRSSYAVRDALNLATIDFFQTTFTSSILNTGYNAWWPGGDFPYPLNNPGWYPRGFPGHENDPLNRMRVFGDGSMWVFQPKITLTTNCGASPTFYLNGEPHYVGDIHVWPEVYTFTVSDIPNYVFDHFSYHGYWLGRPATVGLYFDGELKAYYNWSSTYYTLSISSSGGGHTNPTGDQQYLSYSYAHVEAVADPGWVLDHWQLGPNNMGSNPTIDVYMDAPHTLQAVFVPAPSYQFVSSISGYDGPVYSPTSLVGWQPDGQFAEIDGYGPYYYYGWISGAMNAQSAGHIYMYGYGDGPLYVYVSNDGYNWNLVSVPYVSSGSPYWIDCGTYLSPFNYIAVTAEDPNYFYSIALDSVRVDPPTYHTLTISSGSGGSTTPSPGAYQYAEGAPVAVTANPDSGYVLDYWLLDGNNAGTQNPITVTMNSDHTLQANFREGQVYHTLTVDAYDGYFGNPLYSGIWIDGDLKGYGYVSVPVTEGWHTVLVEDPVWNDYGFYDYFSYFTDGYGNGANHPVYSDTYITAVYYPW